MQVEDLFQYLHLMEEKTEISTYFDFLWLVSFFPFSLLEEHYNVKKHNKDEI